MKKKPLRELCFPDTSPEEEFDLFGCGPGGASAENPITEPSPTAAQASPAGSPAGSQRSPFGQFQQAAGGAATAGVPPAATAGAGADFQSIILEMLRQQNQTTMEMLRQQSLTMQQNQQMCAAMLRRMDLEEKRRNEADEKAAETARIAAEAALKAKTSDPFCSDSVSKYFFSVSSYWVCVLHPGCCSEQGRKVSACPAGHRSSGYGQRTHERSRVLAQFSGNAQLVACFAG